jgi:hypothetical protein
MTLNKHLFARLYRAAEPGDESAGPTENGGDAVGSGNDARVAMLESINDANDVVRAEELAEVNDDGTTSEFVVDETTQAALAQAEAEANGDTQAATQEQSSQQAVTAEEKRWKLKINGREREFTEAELVEKAQKVEAADEYLIEASRIRRDLEQQAAKNTQAADANPSGQSATESLEKRRALVRAIQMGTEEEADAALEELLQPQKPALNAVDVARVVDERTAFKEAFGRFESEYQDVMSDPVLRSLALQSDQRLLSQGDKRPYLERYQAIGNDIRAWVAGKAPKTEAAPPPDTQAGRAQRKASAPAPVKAAQARAPAASRDDEGEESVTDVIAGIAKARGGPQWLRS